MSLPDTLVNNYRIYDQMIYEWIGNCAINYGTIEGTDKTSEPILRTYGAIDESSARVASQLVRKGLIDESVAASPEFNSRDYKHMMYPYVNINRTSEDMDIRRGNSSRLRKFLLDPLSRRYKNTLVPNPIDLTYTLTVQCLKKYTAAHIKEWFIQQFGAKGASTNEIWLKITVPNWGNYEQDILISVKLTSLINNALGMGDTGAREIQFNIDLIVNAWFFKPLTEGATAFEKMAVTTEDGTVVTDFAIPLLNAKVGTREDLDPAIVYVDHPSRNLVIQADSLKFFLRQLENVNCTVTFKYKGIVEIEIMDINDVIIKYMSFNSNGKFVYNKFNFVSTAAIKHVRLIHVSGDIVVSELTVTDDSYILINPVQPDLSTFALGAGGTYVGTTFTPSSVGDYIYLDVTGLSGDTIYNVSALLAAATDEFKLVAENDILNPLGSDTDVLGAQNISGGVVLQPISSNIRIKIESINGLGNLQINDLIVSVYNARPYWV